MIRILDQDLVRLAAIRTDVSATRHEQLNGEDTLSFEAVMDIQTNALINADTIFETDDDYFDLAMYNKHANDDGTITVEIEAEQVSYRLNDPKYNVTDFEWSGTPATVLTKILSGTGFTVGVVEFPDEYSWGEAGGEVSRRQLLMQFATKVKGELIFDKFTIGIVKHRGSIERKPIVRGKHVKVVSKMVDKRDLLPNGDYKIEYDCEPILLPEDIYTLGDDIKLMERNLSIFEDLRIVDMSYNPYDRMDAKFVFANGPQEYYGSSINRQVSEVKDLVTTQLKDLETKLEELKEEMVPEEPGEPGEKDGVEFRLTKFAPAALDGRNKLEYFDPNMRGTGEWVSILDIMFRSTKDDELEFKGPQMEDWKPIASGTKAGDIEFRIHNGELQYKDPNLEVWRDVGGITSGSAVILERLI